MIEYVVMQLTQVIIAMIALLLLQGWIRAESVPINFTENPRNNLQTLLGGGTQQKSSL